MKDSRCELSAEQMLLSEVAPFSACRKNKKCIPFGGLTLDVPASEALSLLQNDFIEGRISERTADFLLRLKDVFVTQGRKMALTIERYPYNMMRVIHTRPVLPPLRRELCNVTSPETLISYTRDALYEYIRYCFHDGLREGFREKKENEDLVDD